LRTTGSRLGKASFLVPVLLLAGCTSTPTSVSPATQAKLFVYPHDNSTTVDPFVPFAWTAVEGASNYTLNVGTTPGARDVYVESNIQGNVTKRTVWGLSPKVRYYASLYVEQDGAWSHEDISFQTTQPKNSGPATRAELYSTITSLTAAVRLSTKGLSNYPTPGTPLAEEVADFGLTGASCTNFANTLVRLLSEKGIYSRRVSLVIVDWVTHVVVEYWDPYVSGWSVADPTFGAVYFDSDLNSGQSAAHLSQDILSESFSDIKIQFVTPSGPWYMNNYELDPVTNFLNVVPQGAYIPGAAKNPPYQYLIPTTPGQAGCFEFHMPDGSSSVTLDSPATGKFTIGEIVLRPLDDSGWQGVCVNQGWSITSEPDGTALYAFRRVLF